MAAIDDYASGRILHAIRRAHRALRFMRVPVAGRCIGAMMERRMESFATVPITMDIARGALRRSRCCSSGPRVCSPLFPESPASEAIFLDDLAEAMAGAGKARMVTGEEAVRILERYPEQPLLCSKVSGRYLEICRSEPSVCIYWKMRQAGMKV